MTDYPTLADEQEFYRILWYGDPGNGKTTAIASAAKLGKVIYIDAENGLKAKALRKHGIPVENIEPHRDVSYTGLERLHRNVLERLHEGENIFAVAWDTTTKTQAFQLEGVVEGAAVKAQRIGKEKTEFDAWQDDYGTVSSMMRKLLRKFHGLPCHLLVGAHQRRDVDEETSTVSIGPAMSPAIAQDFNGYMDCVIHCRVEMFGDDEEFSGLTRPRGRFVAKDRFGLLPPVLIDPTFDRVAGYLDERIDREKDAKQLLAKQRRFAAKATEAASTEEPQDEEKEPAKVEVKV